MITLVRSMSASMKSLQNKRHGFHVVEQIAPHGFASPLKKASISMLQSLIQIKSLK